MIRLALTGVLAGVLLGIPSGTATSVTAAEDTADRVEGRQVFVFLSTDPSEESKTLIAATGPIHAQGVDIVTGEFTDKLKFPDGTVRIKHKPTKEGNEIFDPVTCYFKYSEKGTWKVTGGTGAYADVEGGGKYKVSGEGIGCEENAPPEAFYFKVRAVGDLSY